jgi:DNA-binding MarR family transcriptional regulator
MQVVPGPDRIDELVGQWRAERPDLDVATMGLVARVLAVAALLDRGISALAAEHGLNRGEGDVLFTLRRSGPPYRLSPSRLAAATLVTSGTMTNRLDRLEQKGWVRRIPSEADRRSLDIELTEEARRVVDEAVTEHVRREDAMLSGLSAREREQLDRLTRKLLAHLQASSG